MHHAKSFLRYEIELATSHRKGVIWESYKGYMNLNCGGGDG